MIARISLAVIALVGCTASAAVGERSQRAEKQLTQALAGRTAGEPVNCISASRANGPQIIDRGTILYHDMKTVWRNDLPAACPGMDDDDLLVVEMTGSQLCKNDLVTPVDRGSSIPGARCRLGQFTPYRK